MAFVDRNGMWLETAWDIFSLGMSIVDVWRNPTDPLAWAGLAGDAVDVLVPCFGGFGETIKGAKAVSKVADSAQDASKVLKKLDFTKKTLGKSIVEIDGKKVKVVIRRATDFTDETKDLIKTLDKTAEGYTKSSSRIGQKIHQGYKKGAKGLKKFVKEYKEFDDIPGIRPDYYNKAAGVLYELKPCNPQSIKRGLNQVEKYANEISKAIKNGSNDIKRVKKYISKYIRR